MTDIVTESKKGVKPHLLIIQELRENQDNNYYDESGCCRRCSVMDKVVMEENGIHIDYDVWYQGKFYSCVCTECKCRKCTYYNESERKCSYPDIQK